MLGIKWFHRVPRSESRKRMNLPSLEEIILRRQLRWAGHVVRMPPDRLPRQVLYGELRDGRRSAGGQKKRFKDNLKRTLKQFEIDPKQMETGAAERSGWRQKVSAGAAAFGLAYDAAEAARRQRRHNPPSGGAHQCNQCDRSFETLSGLMSHTRAHLRRAARNLPTTREEDVIIGTDGPP